MSCGETEMSVIVQKLQARFYPDPLHRSPVPVFVDRLMKLAVPGSVFLDIGAGGGKINTYRLKGLVKKIIGVDVSPLVTSNPLVDKGLVYDGARLPLADGSVDIAFSIYVQEHVADPARFVSEIGRVLRPGGRYLALTPNRFHYVPAFAHITPLRFHEWINARRGRRPGDTFPTHYLLNSKRQIQKWFGGAGFSTENIEFVEVQPNYLMFHPLAFLLGMGYERMVNAVDWLKCLRVNIIFCVRKAPRPT